MPGRGSCSSNILSDRLRASASNPRWCSGGGLSFPPRARYGRQAGQSREKRTATRLRYCGGDNIRYVTPRPSELFTNDRTFLIVFFAAAALAAVVRHAAIPCCDTQKNCLGILPISYQYCTIDIPCGIKNRGMDTDNSVLIQYVLHNTVGRKRNIRCQFFVFHCEFHLSAPYRLYERQTTTGAFGRMLCYANPCRNQNINNHSMLNLHRAAAISINHVLIK